MAGVVPLPCTRHRPNPGAGEAALPAFWVLPATLVTLAVAIPAVAPVEAMVEVTVAAVPVVTMAMANGEMGSMFLLLLTPEPRRSFSAMLKIPASNTLVSTLIDVGLFPIISDRQLFRL